MTQVSTGETEVVAKKPETTNEHEKTREKKERVRPPTKVVIRRLPPTLTKDAFINQISPLPEHDYFYFVRPDKSLGPFAFSRAYINFNKQEDIFTFKEQFDNYTFMDKKGNEYPAVVEFAPFQRLPKKRMGRKKDPKMGTLEQDPAYISFLENKAAKPTETGSTQNCPLEYFPPPEKKKITTTPLLDFLRQRRAERQRLRDERREERRRKEQERKRVKDADRDRRRGIGKPDSGSARDTTSDSVLKSVHRGEPQRQEWHEKNYKDKDGRCGIWPHKYESRHKKLNLDYDDPRLFCYKSDEFEDEDILFQIADSLDALSLGISSTDCINSKCEKTKELETCSQSDVNSNLHDKQIKGEANISEGNDSSPMKEVWPDEKEKSIDCKTKTPSPFQNRSTEHANKFGRRTVCFKEFVVPVLKANCGRLKQIERARKLKLAALKPEVPQPRVIKIISLDCDIVKSKDYEFKLLVRPPVTGTTSGPTTSIQKIEHNGRNNKSGNVETSRSRTARFGEGKRMDLKKYLETVFWMTTPQEIDKLCDDFEMGKTMQISFKPRRGKSVEPTRNSVQVSVQTARSFSCPRIASSYSMASRKPMLTICRRQNCYCKMKPVYMKTQNASCSHDSMKELYSKGDQTRKSCVNKDLKKDDIVANTNGMPAAWEIKNSANVNMEKTSSAADVSRETSEHEPQHIFNLNNTEPVQCSSVIHKRFTSKNPWKCPASHEIFIMEHPSKSFPPLLANTQAKRRPPENQMSRNKAEDQSKTSPRSKTSEVNTDNNRIPDKDGKKKQIKNAEPADVKPLSSHAIKLSSIQDTWKMKHESDADWPVPFIPRQTKESAGVPTESQTCYSRPVYVIQDTQCGFLPSFKSKSKEFVQKSIRCTEQTSKKENDVTFQDDNAFHATDKNQTIQDGSQWYTPFPLRNAGKRGGKARPPFRSQRSDCDTIHGLRTDNQTDSLKVCSSNRADNMTSVESGRSSEPSDAVKRKPSWYQIQSNKELSRQFQNSVNFGSFLQAAERRRQHRSAKPHNVFSPTTAVSDAKCCENIWGTQGKPNNPETQSKEKESYMSVCCRLKPVNKQIDEGHHF